MSTVSSGATLNAGIQGLLEVGQIKPGETLVVSGAAGATGSIVCQIGKKKGAKVFAIAGSKEKCEWLEKDIGVDKALNYKSPTFHDDFKKAVGYTDVYFDNVGGEMLDFVLTRLKKQARIVLCGMWLSGMRSCIGRLIVTPQARSLTTVRVPFSKCILFEADDGDRQDKTTRPVILSQLDLAASQD